MLDHYAQVYQSKGHALRIHKMIILFGPVSALLLAIPVGLNPCSMPTFFWAEYLLHHPLHLIFNDIWRPIPHFGPTVLLLYFQFVVSTLLYYYYSDFSIYRPCLYSTKHFTPGPGRRRWADTKWERTMDFEICKIFRHKIWSHGRIMGSKGWAYSSNHTLD